MLARSFCGISASASAERYDAPTFCPSRPISRIGSVGRSRPVARSVNADCDVGARPRRHLSQRHVPARQPRDSRRDSRLDHRPHSPPPAAPRQPPRWRGSLGALDRREPRPTPATFPTTPPSASCWSSTATTDVAGVVLVADPRELDDGPARRPAAYPSAPASRPRRRTAKSHHTRRASTPDRGVRYPDPRYASIRRKPVGH